MSAKKPTIPERDGRSGDNDVVLFFKNSSGRNETKIQNGAQGDYNAYKAPLLQIPRIDDEELFCQDQCIQLKRLHIFIRPFRPPSTPRHTRVANTSATGTNTAEATAASKLPEANPDLGTRDHLHGPSRHFSENALRTERVRPEKKRGIMVADIRSGGRRHGLDQTRLHHGGHTERGTPRQGAQGRQHRCPHRGVDQRGGRPDPSPQHLLVL